MTLHDATLSPTPDGAEPDPMAGGATVGDLRHLNATRALVVMILRDWFDGRDGPDRVAILLSRTLGASQASEALTAWDDLASRLSTQARRPILRHGASCTCVGADEAVVSLALDLAAQGASEDAMMMLALLIPGDRVLGAHDAARRSGLFLRRAALRLADLARRPVGPTGARLH